MVFKCPCGASLNLKPEHQGLDIGCPTCGRKLRVPGTPVAPVQQPIQPLPTLAGQRPRPQQRGQVRKPAIGKAKKSDSKNILVMGAVVGGILLLVGGLALAGLFIWRSTEPVAANSTGNTVQESVSQDEASSPESDFTSQPEPDTRTNRTSQAPAPKPQENTETQRETETPTTSPSKLELVDLIELVEPSVVRLDVNSREGQSIGSGVFVGDEGYIVTNFHVVQGARAIAVSTPNGEEVAATGFFVANPENDLAVISIGDELSIPPIELADSLPRKGTSVAAFGSPLGFSFSATEGVVNSVRNGTEIQKSLLDLGGVDIYQLHGYSPSSNWIQTSAAISGGNSGGPLVDMNGKLVGINTWTVPSAQNLNFAADVEEVRGIVELARKQQLKPFSRLPKETINVQYAANGGRGSRPLTPKEKAIRDMLDSRKKAGEAVLNGSEEIIKGQPSEQFEASSESHVARYFSTGGSSILKVRTSLDKKYLAAISLKGTVFVFDLNTGKLLYKIIPEHKRIRKIAFSANPTRLYTLRDQGQGAGIAIRRPEDGTWKTKGLTLKGSASGTSLAVSTDGRTIFGGWKSTSMQSLWRFTATGDSSTRFSLSTTFGNGGGFTIGNNGGIFLNTNRRIPYHAEFTHDGVFLITGFSDGWISSSSGASDGMNNVNAKELHIGRVNDIAISKDNSLMVSGGEGGYLRLTKLTSKSWSGNKLGDNKNGEVLGVAFSDQGIIAASRANRTIEFYDSKTRKIVKTIQSNSVLTDLEFMNDNFLIAGGKSGRIRIISIKSIGVN